MAIKQISTFSLGLARRTVFICYSHRDTKWAKRLEVHIKPLERFGEITRWDDALINAGVKWKQSIREALETTRVAILLVSADFLASEYITEDELPPLLEAAEEGGAVILPVIVSPCRFERTETLSQFQAVNNPSQPLIRMTKGRQEEVFAQVAAAIEQEFSK